MRAVYDNVPSGESARLLAKREPLYFRKLKWTKSGRFLKKMHSRVAQDGDTASAML
jgi:hypothetical protein